MASPSYLWRPSACALSDGRACSTCRQAGRQASRQHEHSRCRHRAFERTEEIPHHLSPSNDDNHCGALCSHDSRSLLMSVPASCCCCVSAVFCCHSPEHREGGLFVIFIYIEEREEERGASLHIKQISLLFRAYLLAIHVAGFSSWVTGWVMHEELDHHQPLPATTHHR